MYAMLETRCTGIPVAAAGQDPVPCMRFTIEPMEWTHKPLLFYAVCRGLSKELDTVSLWNEGFSKHKAACLTTGSAPKVRRHGCERPLSSCTASAWAS